jgi:hypothetical protein
MVEVRSTLMKGAMKGELGDVKKPGQDGAAQRWAV